MIPKVIHYCWFGGKPLPKDAERCISSWNKFMPDYQIKQWDESNFDIDSIPYTREAYNAKKYAFVSDYARFWIMYHYGGIYFDTDVEVVKPIEDIIANGNFMGAEQQDDNNITVNPGLGFGMKKNSSIIYDLMKIYQNSRFICEDGTVKVKNIVEITTNYLKENGLVNTNKTQQCCGCTIYPKDYFCPIDYDTKELKITRNTRTIHHYAESWVPLSTKIKNNIGRVCGKKIIQLLIKVKKIIKLGK